MNQMIEKSNFQVFLELFGYYDCPSDFEVNIWHKSHIHWRHNFLLFAQSDNHIYLMKFWLYNVHLGIILPGGKKALLFYSTFCSDFTLSKGNLFFNWEYKKVQTRMRKKSGSWWISHPYHRLQLKSSKYRRLLKSWFSFNLDMPFYLFMQ